MQRMEIDQGLFTFIVALAAVINGLGVVRIVSSLADYIRQRESLSVSVYWVYLMLVLFQLLAHILLWWALVGLREIGTINFLQYLHLLLGPTLLFLATSLLIPKISDNSVDLRIEYERVRKPYYSISAFFQAWTITVWPVFGYPIAPTWIFPACWIVIMTILRLSKNATVHSVLVSAIWMLLIAYIGIYAMQLGGVSHLMTQ
jgi:hypothetical protein